MVQQSEMLLKLCFTFRLMFWDTLWKK